MDSVDACEIVSPAWMAAAANCVPFVRQTVNVSPLTTIAVKAARCAGNDSQAGLNQAWDTIDAHLNIGLDSSELGDPMTQAIDGNNIETAVLANEALGELVRARVLDHSGVDLRWEIRRIGRLQGA